MLTAARSEELAITPSAAGNQAPSRSAALLQPLKPIVSSTDILPELVVGSADHVGRLNGGVMAIRVKKSCETSIDIEAPIESVWELVGDPTRAGEWSVECRGGEWLDDTTAPAAGARFRGRNRRNATRWSRVCEVLEVDAPQRLVWRTMPTRLLPDSTRWEFELVSNGAGTTLIERMQVLHIPNFYDRLFAAMLPQHRDRTADLQADLQRIKTKLEAGREVAA